MLVKKLEYIFIFVVMISTGFLASNYYDNYMYENNELSDEYKVRIYTKEQEILQNMNQNFGFSVKFPLIVTDRFKGRLYGLTSYENGEIKIYLNKKVMQESMDYMVESVIAHEYAHALLFQQGYIHEEDGGHSKLWKDTCKKLGGQECRQYVNQEEIIMSKMPF